MAASQFLLLGLGDSARVGGNVRVLADAATEAEAAAKLEELDSSVVGHIVVAEVKQHFERRPAVLSTPSEAPLFATDKKKP